MPPAHFHDINYDHIWSKILQELTKSPAKNIRAVLKSKIKRENLPTCARPRTTDASYEQCQYYQYYTSVTLKNLSYFHDLLTAELRDYADLIKFLNMSPKPDELSRVLMKFN